MMDNICQADLAYFIVPNYCGYPCANYFAFNERTVGYFNLKRELMQKYMNVPKRFIMISNTEGSNFANAMKQQVNGEPDILYLKSGKYGKNLYTRVNSVWHRGESYYHLGWRGRWTEEGGGCTQNHSIHHIDLLLYAKGMPSSIRSFMTNLAHHNSEEEDFSSSVLRYNDGSIAEITSTLVAHGDQARQALSFDMEDASICIPFAAYASKPMPNGFPQVNEEKLAEVIADYESRPTLALESHDGQVENFLRAVNGKEDLVATAQDGRNCIELITGIYQSSITDREVVFPIAKDSPYYTSEWRKDAPHFFEKELSIDAFADTTITSF